MVSIYREDYFLNLFKVGDSLQSNNFTFVILIEGEIIVELNKILHEYSARTVLLISPYNLYKIVSLSTNLKGYILSMDRYVMRRKINFNFNRYEIYKITNIENKNSLIYFHEDEFRHIVDLSEQILFYQKNLSENFRDEVLINLYSVIVYSFAEKVLNVKSSIAKKNSRKEEITVEFISLVYENFKLHKELSYYADKLHVSIKYLSNCVRITTNVPPTQIIADATLTEAKILLLNKQNTIKAISNLLGFSDQYAFGKFFKKNTNYSPLNFRKINNKVLSI